MKKTVFLVVALMASFQWSFGQLCSSNETFGRGLVPISGTKNYAVSEGNIYNWTFTGVVGTEYTFSSCNGSEDTYISILNETLSVELSNDDYGPECSGTSASIKFAPTKGGIYYVELAHFNCQTLSSSFNFSYSSGPATPPSVTGFNPTPAYIGRTFSILGSNFWNVSAVYFPGIATPVSPTNNGNYLLTYVPDGALNGTLTLTGVFGSVITSSLSFLGALCSDNETFGGGLSITTVNQNFPVVNGNIYNWTFSGLAGYAYAFSSCEASEDTYIKIYNSTKKVIASNDDGGPYCGTSRASLNFFPIINDVYTIELAHYDCVTLTSSFNLNYSSYKFTLPTVTGFNPNPVRIGQVLTLLGTNFQTISGIYFPGYGSKVTPTTISATYITAIVPVGALPGTLTLTGNYGNYITPSYTINYTLCDLNEVFGGGLVPTSSRQNFAVTAGNIYNWTFTGFAGGLYLFSSCASSNDTYLRIYNSSKVQLAYNDDNGIDCSGNTASILFAPTSNGIYYVELSNYKCELLTGNFNFAYVATTTGIPTNVGDTYLSEEYDSKPSIYPNPNQGQYQLNLPKGKNGNVQVINEMGQVVLTKPLTGKLSYEFDMVQLLAGIYTLKANFEDGTMTILKFIKE